MKEVNVMMLETGDVLAKPVLARNGLTMLGAGTKLTEYYINRLKKLGIPSVTIAPPAPPAGAVSPSSSEAGMLEQADKHEREAKIMEEERRDEAFLRLRKTVHEKVTHFTDSNRTIGRVSNPALEERFRRVFRNVMYDVASHRQLMDKLTALCEADRSLFEHSLNVALLSGIIGIAQNYDVSQLLELTVGALFFDIGMTRVPAHIFRSKRPLDAEQRKTLEQHTVLGYKMMLGIDGVSRKSAQCALMHHERYKGGGYPFGIAHPEIPEYAQIVAIADVYDALTSTRHHRIAFQPSEATEFLFASGNDVFDWELVKVFLRHISIYPVSSVLKLSSGQIGIVSSFEVGLGHRPVVRILREADGEKVKNPYEIDLKKQNNIVVEQSIQE